jgi:predicted acylesterase/phospholipase RssA
MVKPYSRLGKIGFVLTGGSLRGAFQAGALKAFKEANIIPSYVVGASVGAVNGATFSAGKLDTLIKTYLDIAAKPKKYLYKFNYHSFFRGFFWSQSILVNKPLKEVLEERLGFQNLISSPIKLDILTTDYQGGGAVVFSNKNPKHQNPELLANALLASSAMPTVFPPFVYKKHQLFDGEVREKVPISFAIKEKCDTIFVILDESREHLKTNERFDSVHSIIQRTVQLVSWHMANKNLYGAEEINKDIKAYKNLSDRIIKVIDAKVKNKDLKNELKKDLTGLLGKKNISCQRKRLVNLFIIEPDPKKENKPSLLNFKSIPAYLDSGYNKTLKILKKGGLM